MVAGDDVVHEICRVQWGKRTLFDILALTDRRIVLLGKGVIRSESEDYPLSRVSSISVRKKMLSTAVQPRRNQFSSRTICPGGSSNRGRPVMVRIRSRACCTARREGQRPRNVRCADWGVRPRTNRW